MLKPWQHNAPANKAGATPKPKAWAKPAPVAPAPVAPAPVAPAPVAVPRFDPWAQNDNGSPIPLQHRCVEDPSAGLQRMIGNALRRCPQCDKAINGHPNKKFCGPKCKDRWHNTQNPERLARAIARTGTAEPKSPKLSGLSLALERKLHQKISVIEDPDEYTCDDPAHCLGCRYCIDYDDGEGWGHN